MRNEVGQFVIGFRPPQEWFKNKIAWNKGLKGVTIPPSRKGCIPWNKNLKGILVAWNKGLSGLKGENHPNWKGGKIKIECKICHKEVFTYEKNRQFCSSICRILFTRGKKHTKEHKEKIGNSQRGKTKKISKITPLANLIRRCINYKLWRTKCFERDNYTCQLCYQVGKKLVVDHYPKLFSEIFKENNIKTLEEAVKCEIFWDINTGRTLCVKCHLKFGRKR